jgi:hypothetical protein
MIQGVNKSLPERKRLSAALVKSLRFTKLPSAKSTAEDTKRFQREMRKRGDLPDDDDDDDDSPYFAINPANTFEPPKNIYGVPSYSSQPKFDNLPREALANRNGQYIEDYDGNDGKDNVDTFRRGDGENQTQGLEVGVQEENPFKFKGNYTVKHKKKIIIPKAPDAFAQEDPEIQRRIDMAREAQEDEKKSVEEERKTRARERSKSRDPSRNKSRDPSRNKSRESTPAFFTPTASQEDEFEDAEEPAAAAAAAEPAPMTQEEQREAYLVSVNNRRKKDGEKPFKTVEEAKQKGVVFPPNFNIRPAAAAAAEPAGVYTKAKNPEEFKQLKANRKNYFIPPNPNLPGLTQQRVPQVKDSAPNKFGWSDFQSAMGVNDNGRKYGDKATEANKQYMGMSYNQYLEYLQAPNP